jgi:hypothetical protein
LSPVWPSTLLAALALFACSKKAASDGLSSGSSADAELVSPFAAEVALREAAAAASAAAAAADLPGPPLSSCHMDLGLCAQYTGLTAGEFQDAKEKCSRRGSVFDTKPCSEVDLLGTCEHWAADEGITDKAKIYLTKSVVLKSVEHARKFCDTGTFVEAPPSPPPADAKSTADAGRARDR